jgi:hypothetical protein
MWEPRRLTTLIGLYGLLDSFTSFTANRSTATIAQCKRKNCIPGDEVVELVWSFFGYKGILFVCLFVIYLMTSITVYAASNEWIMNWKGCRMKRQGII